MVKKRIYFDVTQLVHWSGKLAGIPRVMYELAVRYGKSHEDVIFVSWVKEVKAYCEIDLPRTLSREEGIVYRMTEPMGLSEQNKKASNTSIRRMAKRQIKRGIGLVGQISPRLSSMASEKAVQLQARNYIQVNPHQGDTVFIPWGEWWDDNFLVMLERFAAQKIKIVPVIHDIGPIVQPQYSGHSTESLTNYCRRIVPISSLVLCVSKNTKNDLEMWLKQQTLTVPRLGIFREGDDFTAASTSEPVDPVFQRSGLKGQDYIMFVGTVELKKNHQLLYYVYKLAKEKGYTLPKLLIVGRPGWHTEHLYELVVNDPDTQNEILFLQDISDEELAWLYDHCLFTIQASFYEGWGIPVAESIARGIPCLAARTSSMVEIAPGIVEHFSANSPEECMEAILRWNDPKELALAKKKVKSYIPTSWDDSFEQIKHLIEEI